MKTYIIGHQKPDTDSVVSALSLTYLYNQRDCFGYQNPTPVVADPINPETTYVLNKFKIDSPQLIKATDIAPEDKIVLVDHNEESQRLPGLNSDQIIDIIDHHKPNLDLTKPIYLTFKTWGSSSTIVYYLMKTNDIKPDKNLASLMLCAIISDTVGFKSATTTDKDKEVSQELAQIAGVKNINALTLEIFKAKSDVSTLSDIQIVTNDFKIYDFAKKVFVSQLETVEQDHLLTKKTNLLKAMQTVKTNKKVDLLFVAITDVLKENTKLLILSDSERQIAKKAFGGQVDVNILDIGPKMSRKKEIAPAIEKALK